MTALFFFLLTGINLTSNLRLEQKAGTMRSVSSVLVQPDFRLMEAERAKLLALANVHSKKVSVLDLVKITNRMEEGLNEMGFQHVKVVMSYKVVNDGFDVVFQITTTKKPRAGESRKIRPPDARR